MQRRKACFRCPLRTAPPLSAELDAVVQAALGTRFSAAVVRVEAGGTVRFERAYGAIRSDDDAPEVLVDARFDIASLTKVFVATVALRACARGVLALDAPLTGVVPEWRGNARAAITLRRILAHNAGFASGADYRRLFDRNVERFALIEEPLVAAPGARVIYSDLGFIALGVILSRAHGQGLKHIVEMEFTSLGIPATRFGTDLRERDTVPATEIDGWRGLVHGEVHDEKAHVQGGVCGHAGLFANARDVAALGELYLAPMHGRPTPLAHADVALFAQATTEQAFDPVLRRGLGWALKTSDENSCGARMSHATFGHTGFTGTCLWVDPQRDLSVTLLTNAVHLGRSDLRVVRAAVCDAAVAEFAR
jgi:CubicO group peptidase (beta-lactamase class C family)